MAKFEKPDAPNIVWASNALEADVVRPETDEEIRIGWEQEKPPYQTENWSMRKVHQAVAYFNQMGIPEWDGSTEYQQDKSWVQAADGHIYIARATNTNRNPSGGANSDRWERFRGDRLATTSQTGVARFATVEEVENGTRNDVAVTPFSLGEGYTGNPAGTVITFAGGIAPDGYFECDGRSLNASTYPELFNAIGYRYGGSNGVFNIPDTRGEFIRGWDHGRGIDAGRQLGTVQSHQIQSHSHTGNTDTAGNHRHGASIGAAGNHRHGITRTAGDSGWGYSLQGDDDSRDATTYTDYAGNHSHSVSIGYAGNHSHSFTTNSTGGSETRPRNIAMMFCIKYE